MASVCTPQSLSPPPGHSLLGPLLAAAHAPLHSFAVLHRARSLICALCKGPLVASTAHSDLMYAIIEAFRTEHELCLTAHVVETNVLLDDVCLIVPLKAVIRPHAQLLHLCDSN